MTHPLSLVSPGTLAQSSAARVALLAPCARLSLRARGDLAPLDAALGLALPRQIGQRAGADGREALCLGPDEWVLLDQTDRVGAIETACAAIYDTAPHSLVNVSGREVTFTIDGPRAVDLMTLGLPRDPASIAPGSGRRTVFDGVSVVLWRDSDTAFRMDVWNSFASHIRHLLETGCRELAAETV